MACNLYDKGDLVKCQAVYADSDGNAQDPTAVFFQVKDPSGNIVTYEYVTDPEVVKSATGTYYVEVDADEVGEWHVRTYSTGTGQAADELTFEVIATEF